MKLERMKACEQKSEGKKKKLEWEKKLPGKKKKRKKIALDRSEFHG